MGVRQVGVLKLRVGQIDVFQLCVEQNRLFEAGAMQAGGSEIDWRIG